MTRRAAGRRAQHFALQQASGGPGPCSGPARPRPRVEAAGRRGATRRAPPTCRGPAPTMRTLAPARAGRPAGRPARLGGWKRRLNGLLHRGARARVDESRIGSSGGRAGAIRSTLARARRRWFPRSFAWDEDTRPAFASGTNSDGARNPKRRLTQGIRFYTHCAPLPQGRRPESFSAVYQAPESSAPSRPSRGVRREPRRPRPGGGRGGGSARACAIARRPPAPRARPHGPSRNARPLVERARH